MCNLIGALKQKVSVTASYFSGVGIKVTAVCVHIRNAFKKYGTVVCLVSITSI